MSQQHNYEETLQYVNTCSKPSELRITDMRFANLAGAPYPCEILKLYTNQGIVGFGEVRDMASKTYALMLKGRILGENPCNIDKIFRRIKQFGFHGRQGGGVSGIEIALWDLAGKAYGIPVYNMLGCKFRDKMRIYCDTDADMTEDRTEGEAADDQVIPGGIGRHAERLEQIAHRQSADEYRNHRAPRSDAREQEDRGAQEDRQR